MSVTELKGDLLLGDPLRPRVQESRAEGFEFVARLALELASGDFDKPGTVLLGRCAGGRLVGVGGLTPDSYLDLPKDAVLGVGRLRHLYVLPEGRHQGIGKELVLALVACARRHYRVLRLRTTTFGAAHFYKAIGFRAHAESDAMHRLELR